jgi:hypothetical protein
MRLVPEKVPSPGRPLGASLGLLQRVAGHRHHPYLDSKAHSGIDSYNHDITSGTVATHEPRFLCSFA